MAWFLLVACLVASLWCLLYWWPNRRLWALAGKIPGPRGYPLIGSALLFAREPTKCLPTVVSLFQTYGRTLKLWLGPRVFILLSDPADIEVILGGTKIINRDRIVTKVVTKFLGHGLLTLRDDTWKRHRKIINSTFHSKILENFIEVFGRKSKILVEKFEKFEGKSLDVYNDLVLCSLDNLCETAMGTSINSQAVGSSEFADCFHTCLPFLRDTIVSPWLWFDWAFARSSIGRRSKTLIKAMHAFCDNVIAKKLDEFRRGITAPGITTASNRHLSSFLDMLIEVSESQGSILSPQEMRDEVITLTGSGFETSAITMSFFLLLIALHPEVQSELHRQLDQVFGSDDRPATLEDLKQLPALERCIKETMRLFPPIPFLPREIDHDVLLPSGYTIPAGANVMILTYVTHRDERNFTKPLKFWPDRWLPENSQNRHSYSYLPFSAGPRNCVGMKYAQLQIRSTLSQVLRRFRVTSPLNMESLSRLEIGTFLGLEKSLKEQYCVQFYKR